MPCENSECISTLFSFHNRIKLNTERLYLEREFQGISNKRKEIPTILKNVLCSIKIPLKNEDYLPRILRKGWYEVQKVLGDSSSELVRLTEKTHDWNICRAKIEPVEPNILLEECFWKV